MNTPPIHDGSRVKARCKNLKLAGKQFAAEMAWTPRKLYRMYGQADWPTGDLQRAGLVLGCDFFTAYTKQLPPPPKHMLLGILVLPEVLYSEAARMRTREEFEKWIEKG